MGGGGGRRKDEEVTVIKSRGPHLAGGEKKIHNLQTQDVFPDKMRAENLTYQVLWFPEWSNEKHGKAHPIVPFADVTSHAFGLEDIL